MYGIEKSFENFKALFITSNGTNSPQENQTTHKTIK